MPKAKFLVTLELPQGVSREEMRQYIEEEVKANIGRFPPEEPIFCLDRNSVNVATKLSPKGA